MAQASKRFRNIAQQRAGWSSSAEHEPGKSVGNVDTSEDMPHVWLRRPVYGLSHQDLYDTVRHFNRDEAHSTIGMHTLTVVSPNDLFAAMSKSKLKINAQPTVLADMLLDSMPDSAKRNVVAVVEDIKQFGAWVGLDVSYPSFVDERQAVAVRLGDALAINYKISPATAHISLARVGLDNISNLDELIEAAPKYVQLGPIER